MIITKLKGGLGNQLFQYALGRRLAYFNNTDLKLDIYEFKNNNIRTYRLGHFNIQENFASDEEINKLKRPSNKLVAIRRKLMPYYKRPFILERFFHFDPNVLGAPNNIYLEGYWQSEKYFKDIEETIHHDFTLKHDLDPINKEIAYNITSSESASLHIRRGDYVSAMKINQIYGTCSLDYYHTAAKKLKGIIPEIHLFVFSDDPEWARENLKLEVPITFIDHNGQDKDYMDLILMSLCHHHIIANSSFSWWGAWLCQNRDKIVFAPANWFKSAEKDTRDLIPDSWHKI
jgi:hypothetical protein